MTLFKFIQQTNFVDYSRDNKQRRVRVCERRCAAAQKLVKANKCVFELLFSTGIIFIKPVFSYPHDKDIKNRFFFVNTIHHSYSLEKGIMLARE